MGELLTVDETASRLRKTPSTVRRWIAQRGLPVHGVTRLSRYCDWDEVLAWLDAQQHARTSTDAPVVSSAPRLHVIDSTTRR